MVGHHGWPSWLAIMVGHMSAGTMCELSYISRQPKCCFLLLSRLCCRQGSASAQKLTVGHFLSMDMPIVIIQPAVRSVHM